MLLRSWELRHWMKNVKGDLGTLKGKISELGNGLEGDGKSNELVKDKLEALEKQKEQLEKVTGKPTGSIHMAMGQLEGNFKTHIQKPLNLAVSAVDEAIGTLGGKFDSKQNIAGIFEHIKSKVGEIKGSERRKKSGVDGIVARFQTYVREVGRNMQCQTTLQAWLDKILTHNGVVVYRLGKFVGDNKGGQLNGKYNSEKGMHDPIKEKTKAKLKAANVYGYAESESPVESNGLLTVMLTSLMKFLDAYANKLDGRINVDNNTFVTELVSKIEGDVKNGNRYSGYNNQHLTPTVEAVLAALTANARRTAGEIGSLILSIDRSGQPSEGSIASILDQITPIATKLHGQLEGATKTPGPPTGPNVSPAQAVDSRLQAVRNSFRHHHASSVSQSPYGDAR
ncbi:Extracellular matrix-binding ebh, putative [Babesia ovata]|uniref:Extracellular matrix-binding ebh, putative n=1 Tax=Babesia ovata TaxID=189622 RepID=A0A2H6KHU1_9APIC|nr:Extracellular matrix-binding ebh, putative [Babesia ovata]GBE62555.1 Extracellular matrix-binding ebh, putative [Babesia ovata]